MRTALIIGAGPGGLTAAYELGKLGVQATVIEADGGVGGLSRTVSYRGYRFDIGGHRFFSKVAEINQLWAEILGEDLLSRPRLSRIYYRNRFFDYPLKPLNALIGLGLLETLRICASYGSARLAPSRVEATFEQWVVNRFGRRLYEIFFKTYTEKVWGIPCSQISADWAAQRIKDLSLGEALRHAFGQRRDGNVATSLIEQFHYPRLGPGMMWERCAELVERQGGQVLCGTRAVGMEHANGRIRRVLARANGGAEQEFAVDTVISTMPLRELVEILTPNPPADVRSAAAQLQYRDYLTVVLIIRRAEVFPDNWIYVHSPEVRLGRIQNYKNWSPEMVPDPSRTALGLEYFLSEGDAEWSWPPERLIETAVQECVRIGIIRRDEVEDGTVVRAPKAYPVYDRDYADHVATVRRYLEQLPGLQVVGRNGQHRYNNQDHSMLAGVYAARNLTGARHDVWSVNTEAEYHESAAKAAPQERLVPSTVAPDALVERVLQQLDPVAAGAAVGVVAGVSLFAATAILLLRGGPVVGPTLALLGQYLLGYAVTWRGAFVGFTEVLLLGFAGGSSAAWLRNRVLYAYVARLQRRAAAKLAGRLLDEV
jgi:protoporphyrinogen oxidase